MRSEVHYEPGQIVTFRMPRRDDRLFGPDAPASVIGKRPPLVQPDGIRYATEVIEAVVEEGDLLITIMVGEPE